MKTAEELKSHFIKNYAPSMLDKKNDVSFVIDLDDLIESYARTHAIEFAMKDLIDKEENLDWYNSVYDEWIESKE